MLIESAHASILGFGPALPSYVVLSLVSFGLASTLAKRPVTESERALALLRNVSSMISRSFDLQALLGSTLEEVMTALGIEAGIFRLFAPAGAHASKVVSRGFPSNLIAAVEQSPEAGTEAVLFLPNRQASACGQGATPLGTELLADALRQERMKFFILYPVRGGDRTLGNLGLASRKPRKLTKFQEAAIHTVADMLGLAILNAQVQEQANKLSEDLITVQQVNKIISQSLDLQETIRRVVLEGKRLVKTSQCHLFLLDDRQQRLVGSASTDEGDGGIQRVDLDLSVDSPAARAIVEKRVIVFSRNREGSGQGGNIPDVLRCGAAIFAPLVTKDQAMGVLICGDDSPRQNFTEEEIVRAETLAHQAAIALENARLFHVVSRSHKEWETTFDAMQDSVSVHDTAGRVVRANAALARRLKTTPPKVIGRHCSEIYDSPAVGAPSCRHALSLQSEGLIVEEVEPPRMGGIFQLSVSPWYDKNNRLAGSIHVAKDISNEKLLQQRLIQSEKLSAIGELISGIAHELNNPLTGVMGYSQLLQLRQDLDDRAKESLLKINNLALRCQKIVQNLLSFARRQKPERTLCNIDEILEQTVELRLYKFQVDNIELVLELDRNLPRTTADAHQLQQVFLNIINNAEQAMLEAHGRGRLVIRTQTDAQNNRIRVEITDDGPGIPEASLSRIFDPFFTTKEVGKGTGLGLSLSYGIIKEHEGNIYALSRVGEGSTFVVELPIISRLQEAQCRPSELMPGPLQLENLVRNKHILVVDDEKYILDFFAEVFRTLPINVDTAGDGEVALEKILQNDYDLVFTDLKMPRMSGTELYRRIQELRPHLLKRVIFLTGDTASPETRTFFESTGNRYLVKPFKIEEIKEITQDILKGASPRGDPAQLREES